MAKTKVVVYMTREQFHDLHTLMGTSLVDENGIVHWRANKGSTKQEFYRELMFDIGLEQKRQEYFKKRKELQGE